MSSRPEWDAFLLEPSEGLPEDASLSWSWSWDWSPSLTATSAAVSAVTVLAPLAVWLSLTHLRRRAETTLLAMRR